MALYSGNLNLYHNGMRNSKSNIAFIFMVPKASFLNSATAGPYLCIHLLPSGVFPSGFSTGLCAFLLCFFIYVLHAPTLFTYQELTIQLSGKSVNYEDLHYTVLWYIIKLVYSDKRYNF